MRALLFLLLVPNVAFAQEECTTFADIQVTAAEAGVSVTRSIEGDEALKWITAFNRVPPPTAYMADHIVFVQTLNPALSAVALLLDDCVVMVTALRTESLERFTDLVLGPAT